MSVSVGDIFAEIPDQLPEEVFEVIANKGSVKIERIISLGHKSPENFWYDQKEDEFVILLSGEATIQFENDNDIKHLSPGKYLFIPAHKKHRIESTHPTKESIWLAVHF